jgi:diaminopimelate epimerase
MFFIFLNFEAIFMIQQFTKMHGLGNDFVIIDARDKEVKLSSEQIIKICNRNYGVGCDQLIIIVNTPNAACQMKIYNRDGTIAEACGNATRCVAKLIGLAEGDILVGTRLLKVKKVEDNFCIDMGEATITPSEIPVLCSEPFNIIFPGEPILQKGYAVSVGNPHLVFILPSFNGINLSIDGPRFECHPLFPQKVNVSFIRIINRETVELKVWERGAGATLACGSAACAAGFISNQLGLVQNDIEVLLPGGSLYVTVSGKKIKMTGPAEISFKGELSC